MITRCGFIAVLGEANAGKSTLINTLIGEKVSIVSAKPHTTRYGIYGILCQDNTQMIFVDTPGAIFRPQGTLQEFMANVTSTHVQEADIYLVVIDAQRPNHLAIEKLLQKLDGKPLIIALNKIDLVPKPALLDLAYSYSSFTPHIMMISGKTGSGLAYLLDHLKNAMPITPWIYPHSERTQISKRFWAEEITREKIFVHVHEEIPYQTHVMTEKWDENKRRLALYQVINVRKEKHRKFLLGHQGQRIRIIGQQARLELSDYIGKLTHLFLHVKVAPTWLTELRFSGETTFGKDGILSICQPASENSEVNM